MDIEKLAIPCCTFVVIHSWCNSILCIIGMRQRHLCPERHRLRLSWQHRSEDFPGIGHICSDKFPSVFEVLLGEMATQEVTPFFHSFLFCLAHQIFVHLEHDSKSILHIGKILTRILIRQGALQLCGLLAIGLYLSHDTLSGKRMSYTLRRSIIAHEEAVCQELYIVGGGMIILGSALLHCHRVGKHPLQIGRKPLYELMTQGRVIRRTGLQ